MINITRILSVIMTIAILISPRASSRPAAGLYKNTGCFFP